MFWSSGCACLVQFKVGACGVWGSSGVSAHYNIVGGKREGSPVGGPSPMVGSWQVPLAAGELQGFESLHDRFLGLACGTTFLKALGGGRASP